MSRADSRIHCGMDADGPLVSIGIPFFNSAPTLLDAIRSVFAQSCDDWELLLLDDGSTDSSAQIAERIHDTRVRFFADGRHRGLAYRLNQTIQLARGRYLARMDSDDLMHPDRLRRQLAVLLADPLCDVVGTAMYTVDVAFRPWGRRGGEPLNVDPRHVLRHGLFCHSTIFGRIEWFQQNPYSEAFPRAEDLELWCRTCTRGRFAVIPTPLYFYREIGAFSLDHYLGSCRSGRAIYRTYGPAMVGRAFTAQLVALSHGKELAYRLFHLLRADRILVRNRSIPLKDAEKRNAKSIIEGILATPVPTRESAQDSRPDRTAATFL